MHDKKPSFPAASLHGWLNLNKPEGISSAQAVARVKRILQIKKIGHAGTLDPLACGVLPLAIGEATKLLRFLIVDDKAYIFTIRWGEETTTADKEGRIIARSPIRPSRKEIEQCLVTMHGAIKQIPPQFSAIKIAGKRAYELARRGVEVKIPARQVVIKTFQLLHHEKDTSQFFVECSKGTYIRSLATDLANKLNTKSHVIHLLRSKVGKFSIENTILLENLEKKLYKADPSGYLLPLEEMLDDIPVISCSGSDSQKLKQGQKLYSAAFQEHEGVFLAKNQHKIVALVTKEESWIKPVRVFNL